MRTLRVTFFSFFSLVGIALALFPELDLGFSDLFYYPETKFKYANTLFVTFIFKSIPVITRVWCAICSIIIVYRTLSNWNWKELLRTPATFLLVASLLGPALVVSYGFKEHMGRARPRDIVEFGGTKKFSAPLEISSECRTNCSFSSAHAAMGYYFSAIAWVARTRSQNIIFLAAFSFGSLVGFGRILQGGHFLSDVVFSFLVVMLTNEISFRLWTYLKNKNAIRT